MVDELSIHRGGDDLVAEDIAPAGERLLDVTIIEARSARADTR